MTLGLAFPETLPTNDRWTVSEEINRLSPAHWGAVRVGDVAKVENGAPFESSHFNKDRRGLPLIRIRDVGRNDPDTFYDGAFDPAYLVEPGDILVGMDGEFRCAKWEGPRGLLNQRVCRVVPDPQSIDGDFLFSTLQPYLSAVEQVTSSVTVKHLSSFTVADLRLIFPPLNEQRRIVAKLDELRARSRKAREALDEVPALLDQLKQSVLAAAFRGDLTAAWREQNPNVEPASKLLERIRAERRKRWEEANPKKKYVEPAPVAAHLRDELPLLPSSWSWASLDELTDPRSPLCYGVVQPGDNDGDVPLVRVCDIDMDGAILTAGLRHVSQAIDLEYARSRLVGGEVLVTVVGTIGRVAVVPPELAGANIARAVARIALFEGISSDWVSLAMRSPATLQTLQRESREVARKTLNIGDLARVPIPVAPPGEMAAAVTQMLGTLPNVTESTSIAAELSRGFDALDQSILAKAFRGELVPQDPNDEPAEALLARVRAQAAERPPARKGRAPK